ncbi:MAG: sigma-70 family RNA polymerase sigma factor [Bacteroidetes bacterium]|nr:sigma-70 family RNA polymerase sigma factor [Bacteroidota bacterium]
MSPKTRLPSEEILVAKLKDHDEGGLRLLYDNYSSALYGVIFRIIREKETAEDVLQETFLKIWNNIASYDTTKARLYTWLLNIARNSAIDKIRSKNFRKNEQVRSIEDYVYTVDRQHNQVTGTDHIGLKKLVDGLKPEQRQLIELLYFGGYTQSEVSDELGIPLGTIKTRVKAAMTRLRELMK